MDTTVSYSNRSNAKRAAEQMIANGTAPAVDYGFKARDDGRFEIVWQRRRPALAKSNPRSPRRVELARLRRPPLATSTA
jgi:hypothetical protein